MLLVTFLLLSLSSSSSPASHLLAGSSSRYLLCCLFPFFCCLVDLYLGLPFVARHIIIYVAGLNFQLFYVLKYCDFVLEGPFSTLANRLPFLSCPVKEALWNSSFAFSLPIISFTLTPLEH